MLNHGCRAGRRERNPDSSGGGPSLLTSCHSGAFFLYPLLEPLGVRLECAGVALDHSGKRPLFGDAIGCLPYTPALTAAAAICATPGKKESPEIRKRNLRAFARETTPAKPAFTRSVNNMGSIFKLKGFNRVLKVIYSV